MAYLSPSAIMLAFGFHIMHHTWTLFNTHSYENPIKIVIFVCLLLGSRTITSTRVCRFSPHIKSRRHQLRLHPRIEPTHFTLFAARRSHRAYPASLLAALDSSIFLSHLFSSLWHTCYLYITSHFFLHQWCNRPSATLIHVRWWASTRTAGPNSMHTAFGCTRLQRCHTR
ncbi:hypothetical protein EV401DRAFT_908200 [Pisolithus croceorrhizus]|nr:hypothetical protein EV401DRAFT_908200 [Pisolithus croceorrhizus]